MNKIQGHRVIDFVMSMGQYKAEPKNKSNEADLPEQMSTKRIIQQLCMGKNSQCNRGMDCECIDKCRYGQEITRRKRAETNQKPE